MTILIVLAALPFALFGAWLILSVIFGLIEAFLESYALLWIIGIGGAIWFFNSGIWIGWF